MKIGLNVFLVSIVLALSAPVISEEEGKSPDAISLDRRFFTDFFRTSPILRDSFLESKINAVVQGRGLIKSIKKLDRFKKHYRIVLVDQDAEGMNLRFVYHIYIDSRNSISLLKEEERLEFSGQLVACTPLNSRRDAYILDIIFEKGAVLVE
ncbi:MAG: hypothetical protein JW807_01555 [Spirochaetes bacterium]|nr:hypothetical protein [Spirochaetota bacterium]